MGGATQMGLTHENSKVWSTHSHNNPHVTQFSKTLVCEQKALENFISHGFHVVFRNYVLL